MEEIAEFIAEVLLELVFDRALDRKIPVRKRLFSILFCLVFLAGIFIVIPILFITDGFVIGAVIMWSLLVFLITVFLVYNAKKKKTGVRAGNANKIYKEEKR